MDWITDQDIRMRVSEARRRSGIAGLRSWRRAGSTLASRIRRLRDWRDWRAKHWRSLAGSGM